MFSGSKKKTEPATPVPAPLPVEAAIATLEALQVERKQALLAVEAGRSAAAQAEEVLNAARERIAAEAEAGNGASRTLTTVMQLRESAEASQVRLTGLTRRLKAIDEKIEAAVGEVRLAWLQWGQTSRVQYEERFATAAMAFDAVVREGLAQGHVCAGWSPVLLRLMKISIVTADRRHVVGGDRFRFRSDDAAMALYDRADGIRQRMNAALQANDLDTATLATGEASENEAA